MSRPRGRPKKSNEIDSEEENVKNLLDVQDLIDQIISSGLDPSIFDVDLDVTFAKNVVDFAVGSEFMDTSLWAKQAEQAVRLFCEFCPECSDNEFLNNVPVEASIGTFRSKVVLLEHYVCPVCKKTKRELFDKHPWELVSCLGQRSGKTALSGGVLVPYYIHRFLERRNPARYFGLMSNSYFEVTFVAVTAGQIKRTLWQAFKEAIAQSPWFKNYIAKIREIEKEKGLTLVKIMDSFVWFGNKQLACSYAAADMKSLRGSTRVLAAIDELAWFNSGKEAVRANADETYTALNNSLKTVRAVSDTRWEQGDHTAIPAMMLNISSPSSQYDKMMRLLKEGERDKRKICFHLHTWQASPLYPRESFETEENNDPISFWRDYGAVPPVANSPFIESAKAIKDMQTNSKPLLSWRTKFIKDKIEESRARYIAADLVGLISDNRTRMIPRCIAVDCGETQNSFAIGIYHLESGTGGDSGGKFNLVCDAVIEAKPEKIVETGELIPVHFPTMFGIIKQLCDRNKGLYVRAVLYDRWQSTGQIQELRDMKIKAERHTPKEGDFKNLRNLVYSGNFKMPKWEFEEFNELDVTDISQARLAPYTNMAIQFATVREIGKKIIKPEVGDDDLFRTSVLATWYMTENQKDFLTKAQGVISSQAGTQVGSLSLKSSRSGSYQGIRGRTTIGAVRGKTSFMRRR